jgi:hypothetical protein
VPGDEHDDAAETTSSTPAEPALRELSSWDRAAPWLVTGFAVVMFGWNVQRNQWSNGYYSAAVRSMGTNWHAFWYASVDSGGWVTVDKPPLSLWLASLSTRLFGFRPWARLDARLQHAGWAIYDGIAVLGNVIQPARARQHAWECRNRARSAWLGAKTASSVVWEVVGRRTTATCCSTWVRM